VALAAGLLMLVPVAAAETDQFLTWTAKLSDSADPVNSIVNREIDAALDEINNGRWQRLACEDLPPRLFVQIHPSPIRPRLRDLLQADPDVEIYPGDDVSYRGYLRQSIYRTPHIPWILPMARTVRIGEVHVGMDKLGHLFNSSRPYYADYRKGLARGMTEEAVLREVVVRGARKEVAVLGGMTDSVVSHADLEANYQGLRLALDLCAKDRPYLERTEDGWRRVRPVDLRDYIPPALDESYNGNQYVQGRWKKVEPVLREEYCPLWTSTAVRQRMRRYRELDRPSPSKALLAGYFSDADRERRAGQAIEAVCREGELGDMYAGRAD